MKNIILILSVFMITQNDSTAQIYSMFYDNAGNRVQRIVTGTPQKEPVDEIPAYRADENTDLEDISNFKVYPNPVEDYVKIEATNAVANGKLLLLDLSGKVLQRMAYKGQNERINFKSYPPGEYFLHLQYEDKELKWKLVKLTSN